MRKLSAAFLIFVAIVTIGSFWTRDTGAGDAYALAEAEIANAIAKDARVLRLDNLTALTTIPPEIAQLENMIQFSLRNSSVSDFSILGAFPKLKILTLRGSRMTDLEGISTLANLEILDIGESWIADLSPLVSLPRLKRLDVGGTQLRTLEPTTRMSELNWINLHGAYAIDGSRAYFDELHSNGVEINNGRAFRENYQPDWVQRSKVRFQRARQRLGL